MEEGGELVGSVLSGGRDNALGRVNDDGESWRVLLPRWAALSTAEVSSCSSSFKTEGHTPRYTTSPLPPDLMHLPLHS